jgi:hypothetical protein
METGIRIVIETETGIILAADPTHHHHQLRMEVVDFNTDDSQNIESAIPNPIHLPIKVSLKMHGIG